MQDSVAQAVAQAIQINVTQQERMQLATPRTVDPEAYEAYLKGRILWDISGEWNLSKAREYFELAIRKDPGYARAWAGLADTYNRLASWGVLPRQEAAPRAQAAAEKALQLDSTLVEGVVALAGVKVDYEWDWSGAERLLKHAIELAPNSGYAHFGYAGLLAATGRKQAALRRSCGRWSGREGSPDRRQCRARQKGSASPDRSSLQAGKLPARRLRRQHAHNKGAPR